jgi:hypothetical protein
LQRLVDYPLPNGAQELQDYKPNDLLEFPGLEFPDLPTVDAYLSFYANHPVTKDKVVYTWVDIDGKETYRLTYSQLDTRASIIAHHLLTSKKPALQPGDRVVLLHPPGLEFIEAFLGCLRARVRGIPAFILKCKHSFASYGILIYNLGSIIKMNELYLLP